MLKIRSVLIIRRLLRLRLHSIALTIGSIMLSGKSAIVISSTH